MIRTLVILGLLLECLAIFGLFLPYETLRRTGTPVTLRTVPVDPRSLLRGDYVVLGYEAGQGLPLHWNTPVVYVVLEQRGDVYERVGDFQEHKPALQAGQVCLRGQPQGQMVAFRDIAQYFVEEGTGREMEQARNAHRLFVDVSVGGNCRAVIRGVRLGPEVPPEELQHVQQERLRTPKAVESGPEAVPPDLQEL